MIMKNLLRIAFTSLTFIVFFSVVLNAQETATKKFYCGTVRDGSTEIIFRFWYDSDDREITDVVAVQCAFYPRAALTSKMDETIDVSKGSGEFSYSGKTITVLSGSVGTDGTIRGKIAVGGFMRLGSSYSLPSRQPLEFSVKPVSYSAYSDVPAITIADPQFVSRYIEHVNPEVRKNAIDSLMDDGKETSLAGLRAALQSQYEDARSNAALALGHCKDTAAVPALIRLLDDSCSTVRWTSARALGLIQSGDAIKPLLKLTEEKDIAVRWFAIEALANFIDPQDSAFFAGALAAKDTTILMAGRKYYIALATEDALNALIDVLNRQVNPWFATDLLESKNPKLVEAVKVWAGKHGYRIR
jgi:hypothetical protein